MKLRGVLIAALIAAASIPGSAFAADYVIDPAHSEIGFSVRHLGISRVSGTFNKFNGTFSYDPKNPSQAKAEAAIEVASINTRQAKRDDHLRADDFFSAAKFPHMKFKSKKVEPQADGSLKVTGELSIRDVTKEVVLDARFEGAVKDMEGKDRAGFAATTSLNRKDFGLAWNKLTEAGGVIVGDQVDITLHIEGVAN